uniref:Uncharacterized protein n=1 Tax=Oryza sativa subsp. japonica TaxID=39947 RepID=Q2QS86_ORYSJ|nr:hypothetical protein LOC_Os12g24980 [Oryza sativa Japonica Group]
MTRKDHRDSRFASPGENKFRQFVRFPVLVDLYLPLLRKGANLEHAKFLHQIAATESEGGLAEQGEAGLHGTIDRQPRLHNGSDDPVVPFHRLGHVRPSLEGDGVVEPLRHPVPIPLRLGRVHWPLVGELRANVEVRTSKDGPRGASWGNHHLQIDDGVENRTEHLDGRLEPSCPASPVEDGDSNQGGGAEFGISTSKSRSISGSKVLLRNRSPTSKKAAKTTVWSRHCSLAWSEGLTIGNDPGRNKLGQVGLVTKITGMVFANLTRVGTDGRNECRFARSHRWKERKNQKVWELASETSKALDRGWAQRAAGKMAKIIKGKSKSENWGEGATVERTTPFDVTQLSIRQQGFCLYRLNRVARLDFLRHLPPLESAKGLMICQKICVDIESGHHTLSTLCAIRNGTWRHTTAVEVDAIKRTNGRDPVKIWPPIFIGWVDVLPKVAVDIS